MNKIKIVPINRSRCRTPGALRIAEHGQCKNTYYKSDSPIDGSAMDQVDPGKWVGFHWTRWISELTNTIYTEIISPHNLRVVFWYTFFKSRKRACNNS